MLCGFLIVWFNISKKLALSNFGEHMKKAMLVSGIALGGFFSFLGEAHKGEQFLSTFLILALIFTAMLYVCLPLLTFLKKADAAKNNRKQNLELTKNLIKG